MEMLFDMMEEFSDGLENGRDHLGRMHDCDNAIMRFSVIAG